METVCTLYLGYTPSIRNLYVDDSNNLKSTNSYRDPDYLKNWRVLFKKVIVRPADNYMAQLRVKACKFRAVMPCGTGVNTLNDINIQQNLSSFKSVMVMFLQQHSPALISNIKI